VVCSLDDIDRRIAATLVADGRRTLRSLAEATGLSVSAVQGSRSTQPADRHTTASGITAGNTVNTSCAYIETDYPTR
jgi:hypothetical protein